MTTFSSKRFQPKNLLMGEQIILRSRSQSYLTMLTTFIHVLCVERHDKMTLNLSAVSVR